MGRRQYITLLALGRSPFEAPEEQENTLSRNLTYGDGYVQEYNARGHPINSGSKARARELRKAKNDVLSTMGIVVGGEDGNSGPAKESRRMKLLAQENDTGLALATIDQIVTFIAKWWTSSLAARIQTFGSYAYVPLMDIIPIERGRLGFFGFYFAGLPVWTASFLISVCRSHFLNGVLEQIYSTSSSFFSTEWQRSAVRGLFKAVSLSARTSLFLIIGQGYLFSLLQSLHVIPISKWPSPHSLVPFTRASIIQLPPLPSRLTPLEIGRFACGVLTSPFVMTYLYVNLRPIIETRIYRIIRRRLPKPDRPDELSLRVALDNDILEWTVPWFGKRADEESSRRNFTLSQEIKHEFVLLKNFVSRLLGYSRKEPTEIIEADTTGADTAGASLTGDWLERYQFIQRHIDQLRYDFAASTMLPGYDARIQEMPGTSSLAREEQSHNPPVDNQHFGSLRPETEGNGEVGQILVDEEHRFAQSPLQIRDDYFSGPGNISRAAMEEAERPGRFATNHSVQSTERERRSSLSNTLFTRPSSPETSPPASPRVRASLIHQNSDVITMHLQLLQGPSYPNVQFSNNSDIPNYSSHDGNYDENNTTNHNNDIDINTSAPIPNQTTQQPDNPDTIERAASEIIDSFLSNQNSSPGGEELPIESGASQGSEAEEVDVAEETEHITQNLEEMRAALAETVPDLTRSQTRQSPILDASQLPQQMDTSADEQAIEATQPLTPHLPDMSEAAEHQVTILSSLPVDAFALHFSSVLASLLIYPVESLYLRYLASTFLRSPYMLAVLPGGAAASVLGPRASVMPLGTWFGGARGSGIITYIGKLVLVSGLDALVSTCGWGLATGIAVMLGKRKFGWGKL